MTLSDQIADWLERDGPFTQGVALYRQTGGIRPVGYYEKYFRSTILSSEVKARLKADLQKYLLVYPAAPSDMPASPATTPSQKQNTPATEEPPAIQALRKRAIPLHKRYSHLKAELYTLSVVDAPDEVKLYDIAREIMSETIPALDAIYDQIREWERTGEVPDMPRPLLVEQTVQKMRQVQSMRSRVSNLRRRIKSNKFSEKEVQEWENEISEKELKIIELSAELGI